MNKWLWHQADWTCHVELVTPQKSCQQPLRDGLPTQFATRTQTERNWSPASTPVMPMKPGCWPWSSTRTSNSIRIASTPSFRPRPEASRLGLLSSSPTALHLNKQQPGQAGQAAPQPIAAQKLDDRHGASADPQSPQQKIHQRRCPRLIALHRQDPEGWRHGSFP